MLTLHLDLIFFHKKRQKYTMDKVSYALGLGIGSQLKSMGAESLNIDDFAQAIKDVEKQFKVDVIGLMPGYEEGGDPDFIAEIKGLITG